MYTLKEIAEICGGTLVQVGSPYPFIKITQFCFDSRTLNLPAETVFIALGTGYRDGHDYIPEVRDKGVRQFIVRRVPEDMGGNFLVVDNPLETLQKLAVWHRNKFSIPVIGITGSNGKTIVKEWVNALLSPDTEIVSSPGSFNSQIGVPISLLRLQDYHELAIIEAGISRAGEMQKLEAMVRPDIMVLTHMGEAHAEGFNSMEDKLEQKLLFGCRSWVILTLGTQRYIKDKTGVPVRTIGTDDFNEVRVEHLRELVSGWSFRIGTVVFQLHQAGPAALENAWLAILTALECGADISVLPERVESLMPVSMRTEMITDNPRTTIINDACTADPDSVRNALRLLKRFSAQPRRMVILSDLDHLGKRTLEIQRALLQEAINMLGRENVLLIGPVYKQLGETFGVSAWETPEALIKALPLSFFDNASVLLKGARRFALEKLVPVLSGKVSATVYRINLTQLVNNYRVLRSVLPQGQKVMAMVKASSYGSGSWEIAQELESEGVDYLAVAYISEGISLRAHGIRTPVMVMNPDPEGLHHLIPCQLEPVVYSLEFLEKISAILPSDSEAYLKIHIEVETGMMRLGFPLNDIVALKEALLKYPGLEIASLFTHLAASEDAKEDEYTRHQFSLLRTFADSLREVNSHFLIHAQNTAGAIRFLEPSMSMVRLGIGLYGVNPVPNHFIGIREIGTLVSRVSQIHDCPKGQTVGYNRSWVAREDLKIATIPLGYADGIPRALAHRQTGFYIREKFAPIAGNICMDMIMLDVTHIPGVTAGDEVLIFGESNGVFQSVANIARALDTIPYEIITGIHPRVRRIYIRE